MNNFGAGVAVSVLLVMIIALSVTSTNVATTHSIVQDCKTFGQSRLSDGAVITCSVKKG